MTRRKGHETVGLLAFVWASSVSAVALAQAPAAPATAAFPQAAPPPAAAPAAPAAPPPAAPPASPESAPPPAPPPPPGAAPYAPPPGYMLVPVAPAPTPPPGPKELAYSEGQEVPPGYRVEERMRRGLVIAGAVMTGVAWSLSVTGAVSANYEDNSGFLMIPVFGPWLMLATGGADDPPCEPIDQELSICQDNAGLRAILVLDGLVQTAGGIMFVWGMTSTSKRLVREDVAIDVVPMRLGRDGHGLGVVGTF